MVKTLRFDETAGELVILDQTKLPFKTEYIRISDAMTLYRAIKELAIRGAPAIGVGAALGLYAVALRFEDQNAESFVYSLEKTANFIASSRPTAKNLFYAADRMTAAARRGGTVAEILQNLKTEAFSIKEEDIALCRAIGLHGEALIKDGAALLTHCNAGALAAVEYGTALAPVYAAAEKGKKVKVYAGETRPLLQGARLTCFELANAGIETVLICDSAAAGLMARGEVDLVLVGCDRVASNGDFANKVGTLSLAVNAGYFGVPFYVAAPSSTLDGGISRGEEIIIEERDGGEIYEKFFEKPVAPAGIKTCNPAFDVTPASLVTGYITEKGVLKSI